MSLLICYLGIAVVTSIVVLFFFEKVYGDCKSNTEGALFFGVIWPITLTAMALGCIFLILDATLKACISVFKNKED